MRKLFLSVLLAAFAGSVFAQKLDDVQEKISKGKYDEAKEKLDKVFEDPKAQTNANAWYYKGKVYTQLAVNDSNGTLPYDAKAQAFEAFKKYQELEPKNTMMLLEQNVSLFQLYDMYYNKGVKNYNDKDYAAAFKQMKKALEIEEYISSKDFSYNNFSFPKLDTQLINLTASSAYLAKMEDDAIPYFARIADAKIGGPEFKEIYGLLVQYYFKKNDQAKADKYLAIGRELYPDNDYWVALEFGDIPSTDTAARIVRYEQLLAKYPDSYPLALDYATEVYNYTYTYDKKPADYEARQAKLRSALDRVLSLKQTAFANFVMAQHIYNEIYDLDDALRAVKGTSAADLAKKKDIRAQTDKKYEEFYPFAQKAYDMYSQETDMKIQDKVNYRKIINELIDYHQRKKQTDKVTFYQDKLKTL
jgi:hypothetical protein